VARLLQQCEGLLALEQRLAAVLKGKAEPRDAAERLALAALAQQPYKRQYTAAARLYADAFAAKVARPDLLAPHRYTAACAAALAVAGKGEGAAKLDDKERARLRLQALDWLKIELAAWTKRAEGPAEQRLRLRRALTHWRGNADLTGVRDKEALDKLPEAERQAWRKLWAEVDDLLKRVGDKK
jgi:hypothetical protein